MVRERTMSCAAAAGLLLAAAAAAGRIAPAKLPLPDFMGHVLQHNAERLWSWTALETDRNGEHAGKPTTPEQWESAESDARTVHQLTLLLGQYAPSASALRWSAHVSALRTATAVSAEAAENRDYDALSRAGDQINAACVSCHTAFAPTLETVPPAVNVTR